MQHDHLKFFNNSMSSNSNVGHRMSVVMGGDELIPKLRIDQNESKNEGTEAVDGRSAMEKQIEVVEYLKKLPSDSKASFVDVQRELNIDLKADIHLLELLKSNPHLEHSKNADGDIFFQYRAKFLIRNKRELVFTINRIKTGVPLSEIKDCYDGIEGDVASMVVGGEIIAISNKEKKTLILFPRGVPFYSQLSGTVTATHGKQLVSTSENLTKEIRRGEAIKVGPNWYRVSCAVGSGALHEQTQRSKAPTSVNLEKEMSENNKYCTPFNGDCLPLDGDYDHGNNTPNGFIFQGIALKHGCTNDVKEIWKKTFETVEPNVEDDQFIHQELIRLGLIRSTVLQNEKKKKVNDNKDKEKKKRQVRARRETRTDVLGVNAHLRGTAIEKILNETRDKINRS